MRAGLLSLLFAALLIVGSEPFLLKAAPPSEYQVRLHLPVLVATTPAPESSSQPNHPMDSSTLLSIGLFASLQVAMYIFCLVKIREIAGTEPVLCMGDFNTTPDTEPIRSFASALREASAARGAGAVQHRRAAAAPAGGPAHRRLPPAAGRSGGAGT